MNRMLTYTTNEDDLQDYVDYLNLIKEGNEALARKTEGEGEKKPNIGRKKITEKMIQFQSKESIGRPLQVMQRYPPLLGVRTSQC